MKSTYFGPISATFGLVHASKAISPTQFFAATAAGVLFYLHTSVAEARDSGRAQRSSFACEAYFALRTPVPAGLDEFETPGPLTIEALAGISNLVGAFDPRFDRNIERAVETMRRTPNEANRRRVAEAALSYARANGLDARLNPDEHNGETRFRIALRPNRSTHWINRLMIERDVSVVMETNPSIEGASFFSASRRIELTLSSLGSPVTSLDARHERGHAAGSTLSSLYARYNRPLAAPVLKDYSTRHGLDEGLQFLRDVRLGNRVLSSLLAAIDRLPQGPLKLEAIATARVVERKTVPYAAHLVALLESDLGLARSMIRGTSLSNGTRVTPQRPDDLAVRNGAGDSLLIRDFSLRFNALTEWYSEPELAQTVSVYLSGVVIPELTRLLALAHVADQEFQRLIIRVP